MRTSGWLFPFFFLTALWFSGCMLGDSLLQMREHSMIKAINNAEALPNGIVLPFPPPEEKTAPIIAEQDQ